MATKYVEYIPDPNVAWRKFNISQLFDSSIRPGFNEISGDTPEYGVSQRSHVLRQSPYYEITAEATETKVKAHIEFEGSYTDWWPTVLLGAYFGTRSGNYVLCFALCGVNDQGRIFDATYRVTRQYTQCTLECTGSVTVTQDNPASNTLPYAIPWDVSGYGLNSYETLSGNDCTGNCYIDTDIPVFDSYESYEAWVLSNGEDLTGCLNVKDNEYELDVTQLYWIYNQIGSAKITYGNVDIQSNNSWKSMKFYGNKPPCFYFNDDTGFSCTLVADKVVSSIGMNGPSYLLDNVPESEWREGELFFTTGFYANIDAYKDAFDKIPSNSTYTYGTTWDTNIPIFKNQGDADGYQEGTIGIDKAVNYSEISNYYTGGNKTGQPENATEFGDVYTRAFFSQMYLCTESTVQEVSNALFDYDVPTLSGMWTQIKVGLEMYGTNPMEVIQGLRYYPFDLSTCFTSTQDDNYLWIGAYKLDLLNSIAKKVIYPNGYIDLGSLKVERAYNDWRDFEPYTKCYIYLPYVGKFPIDLSKYYGKIVNIRYFIDIRSGACCACLIADGVLLDWYDGLIGTDMPITLTDYSNFATSQVNCIMRNMGLGIAGEAKVGNVGAKAIGATINSGADNYGSSWADNYVAARQAGADSRFAMNSASASSAGAGRAMVAGAIGSTLGTAAIAGVVAAGIGMKTTFEMVKNGIAGYTNGRPSSSSMINQYLPQYAMFIFECMDIDESAYLNELYGRPTNKSGTIGSFSGYLQADDVMLICPIATDNERQEIIDLVRAGIYL